LQTLTNKWIIFTQVVIISAGTVFLILAVIFNLPATNDEAIVGLKGIMFMILFVINTSSHSLYASEFYYVNNKCSNKGCRLDLKSDLGSGNEEKELKLNNIEENLDRKKTAFKNILTFNIFILNSSYFLIFSILINILQTAGIFSTNKILIILSFYSFLIFLVVVSINYLLYNYLLYKSLKKIIEED
jgi:hypothetical protein